MMVLGERKLHGNEAVDGLVAWKFWVGSAWR
jgi:hypothetical protein